MPAVEINLTTDQLVTAYTKLSQRERKAFLFAVLTQPTHQQIALELMNQLKATLKQKFSPTKQAALDKLLAANNERALHSSEKKKLDALMNEYGEKLVEKARAQYLLTASRTVD